MSDLELAEIVGAVKGIVSIIEFLKYFLNKKVRFILETSVQTERMRPTIYELATWKKIAEGTVHTIIENPPSVFMKDVEEFILFEANAVKFQEGHRVEGAPTINTILPSKRKIPEKFYMINAIREIEPIKEQNSND